MKKLEPLLDLLGEIIALTMVVVYILALANAQWGFIESKTILNIMNIALTYGARLLVGVVGFEAVSKRSSIIRIIFYICIAIIVLFMFFPDTYQNLIGIIK